MPLTDLMIIGRRLAYGCCAAEAAYAAQVEKRYGNDKCAKEKMTLAKAYWWAEGVMMRTPTSTDDASCHCVTHDFAEKVIKKMDGGCVRCGCGASTDRPINCDIQAQYSSAAVVDASFQDLADPTQPYLIATDLSGAGNEWASHVGELVIGTTYTAPTEGEPIFNVINFDYWTVVGGTAYPYFPRIDAVRDGFDITLTSRAPQVNAFFSRNVLIRVSADATNWIGLYVGSEQNIPTGAITAIIDDALYVDVTYYTQDDDYCRYGPFYGTLEAAQAPFATKSLRYGGLPFLWTSGTQKLDFYPWNEKQWMVSMNIKIEGVQPPYIWAPFSFQSGIDASGGGKIETGPFTYLGSLEAGFSFGVNLPGDTPFVRNIVFPGAFAAMSTGVWRHVTLIRNSAEAGVIEGSDFTLVLSDGTSALTSISGVIILSQGVSYTVPNPEVYDPNIVGNQTIGDYFSITFETYTLNNVYIALHAPTMAEIASVCYPALYEGADATWNRKLWLKAEPPDNVGASPFVDGHASGSPTWKSNEGEGGSLSLVQDKPDWVVP